MSSSQPSSARNRTQRAILHAATTVWARDRSATLPQIAEAAEVGRTTLHRYFPERDGLLRAAAEFAIETATAAIADARPEQGAPREAMRRVVAALASVSEAIMFVFGDPSVLREFVPAADPGAPAPHDPVLDLIRRGQADGVFDAEVSAEWIQQVLWGVSYTAFEQLASGAMARFDVPATVTRTLEHGIAARPAEADR